MQLLFSLLATVTLAFGAAVPTSPNTQEYDSYAVLKFCTNTNRTGDCTVNTVFDVQLTDSYDGTTCRTFIDPYFHTASSVLFFPLYYRETQPNGEPGDQIEIKPRYATCQFFQAGECDGQDGVTEVKGGSSDLNTIGWNDRIGSVRCKWQE